MSILMLTTRFTLWNIHLHSKATTGEHQHTHTLPSILQKKSTFKYNISSHTHKKSFSYIKYNVNTYLKI